MIMPIFRFTTYENALEILRLQALPISNPKYFNDPFDSRAAVDDNDQEAIRLLRTWPSVPITIGVCGRYGNPYAQEIKKYNKLLNDVMNNADIPEIERWRIASFSRQRDWGKYILMWSLYADSHKGVMFEFSDEFENFLKNKYEFLDVKYDEERVMITFKDSLDDRIIKERRKEALTVKSTAWDYEKESRLIIPAESFLNGSDNNLYNGQFKEEIRDLLRVKPEWISKVYCGAMMSDEKKLEISKAADDKSIECVKLRLCAVKYELHDFKQDQC